MKKSRLFTCLFCETLKRFRLNFEYLVFTKIFDLMRFLVAQNNSERNIQAKYFIFSQNALLYEGWNFNSGNYLFTTDTK